MDDRNIARAGAATRNLVASVRTLAAGCPIHSATNPYREGVFVSFPPQPKRLVHGLDSRTNRGCSASACLCFARSGARRDSATERRVALLRPTGLGFVSAARFRSESASGAPTGRWLVFCCSMDACTSGSRGFDASFTPKACYSSAGRVPDELASILPAAEPATVHPSKTATPERVLQATAQYSICGWRLAARSCSAKCSLVKTIRPSESGTGYTARSRNLLGVGPKCQGLSIWHWVALGAAPTSRFSPSTTTSWSYAHKSLKAAEGKLGGAARQDEQGSGVSCR